MRDYIHVTDLASAHKLALEYLLEGGESSAFNLGSEKGHSVQEIIESVEKISGRRVSMRYLPARPGDAAETHRKQLPGKSKTWLGLSAFPA